MDLLAELARPIRAFVNRRMTLEQLHFELSDYVLDVAEANEPSARALFASAFRLIGEHGRGHRTTESARIELRRDLDGYAPPAKPKVTYSSEAANSVVPFTLALSSADRPARHPRFLLRYAAVRTGQQPVVYVGTAHEPRDEPRERVPRFEAWAVAGAASLSAGNSREALAV